MESLPLVEIPLSELQLYRRPLAFVLFTVCHTSDQLRIALEQFSAIKQRQRDRIPYIHLFVQYKITFGNDADDDGDSLLIDAIEDS